MGGGVLEVPSHIPPVLGLGIAARIPWGVFVDSVPTLCWRLCSPQPHDDGGGDGSRSGG